jgi:hypothetical protein
MYSPSPTVKASRVPLYQLGWLGDDGAGDPSLYDIQYGGGTPDYSPSPDFVATLTYPDTGSGAGDPSLYDIQYGGGNAAAYEHAAAVAASQPSSLTSTISNAFRSLFPGTTTRAPNTLLPGPAPRVSSTPTQTAGVSSWIQQNFGLLAIGAIGLVVLPQLIGGRRR